ncbi:hypothetical protein H5410_008999 [Solanum commersonii]|uniref:Uncharacterized protein n=1 Tax=Solanum commersonii TaxID=4109 RepID=A0A9J6AGK4_SOLCO|nr:hypothetical protein H5410_008999 [Solanum commersonii]
MPQSKLKVVFIKNVHQQDPSSNDCGLYAYLLVKYISNEVFDMGLIHIDAKYHCKSGISIGYQLDTTLTCFRLSNLVKISITY